MISHTTEQLVALKGITKIVYLLSFEIGNTTYRFSSGDAEVYHAANPYYPGFIDEMPDIEITSQPTTNDISIDFYDESKVLSTALLSQNWMNKPLKATKQILDANGNVILNKIAFQGYLSDFSIDAQKSITEITASSIWADFEKTSGIKTNAKSQQRYYPNDTAFEHSQSAVDKVYWGKDGPKTQGSTVPSSPYGSPRVQP
ncbi:hypothetical protein [Glaciecola sp. KUL10]|uniref:hypothetical protein n=1 Tax=Glaciecola sp. (strain KUL10) TaxID=2161813 RepID=UPI000D788560|nr:hypothetical protein [Glaciecola sp. KUL10]GBL02927.1 hypothetical protein KUL10_02000 [Glaciecola sp. KUL10]